jgi:hypothetical protein
MVRRPDSMGEMLTRLRGDVSARFGDRVTVRTMVNTNPYAVYVEYSTVSAITDELTTFLDTWWRDNGSW